MSKKADDYKAKVSSLEGKVRPKMAVGTVDFEEFVALTSSNQIAALVALLGRQDRLIRDLEDRVRILERGKRYGK